MISARLIVAVSSLIVLGAGCASSPQANFYTLRAQRITVRPGGPAAVSITVSGVNVPEIVDRPQIVVRLNPNEVRFNEFARWAESLKSQIQQVVVEDLAMQFPSALVSKNPGAGDISSMYRVFVDVQSFELALGDAAAMSVVWIVRPPKGQPISGRSVVYEATDGAGYDPLVAAQSRALAHVSDDVATAIRSSLQK